MWIVLRHLRSSSHRPHCHLWRFAQASEFSTCFRLSSSSYSYRNWVVGVGLFRGTLSKLYFDQFSIISNSLQTNLLVLPNHFENGCTIFHSLWLICIFLRSFSLCSTITFLSIRYQCENNNEIAKKPNITPESFTLVWLNSIAGVICFYGGVFF